jgi:hypothetical protein
MRAVPRPTDHTEVAHRREALRRARVDELALSDGRPGKCPERLPMSGAVDEDLPTDRRGDAAEERERSV